MRRARWGARPRCGQLALPERLGRLHFGASRRRKNRPFTGSQLEGPRRRGQRAQSPCLTDGETEARRGGSRQLTLTQGSATELGADGPGCPPCLRPVAPTGRRVQKLAVRLGGTEAPPSPCARPPPGASTRNRSRDGAEETVELSALWFVVFYGFPGSLYPSPRLVLTALCVSRCSGSHSTDVDTDAQGTGMT